MKSIIKSSILFSILLFCFFNLLAQEKPVDTTEVSVTTKNVTLSGTLFTTGNKKKAVVLIIAGSGPTDRDGNSPLIKGKNNSLLQIAAVLAENGISSLRYDKRGIGKSKLRQGITEDSLLFSDMVNDAEALYNYLKENGFKKIYIAGHSEGSLIGMVLANKVDPAGYISIAGVGRNAADILKEQLATLPENLKDESYTALDSLKDGYRIKKVNPQLFSLFRPSVQPYLISWFTYDPEKIIKVLNCRILILQGTTDIQVKETDAENLKAANPKAKLVIIKNMNHILKEVNTLDKAENIKSYSNPVLQVMKQLTDEMINFIKKK